MTPTADLVARYADSVNTSLAARHGVVSPLGIWLLLALTAPACEGQDRDNVEDALGLPVEEAAAAAAALLADPHPAVSAAVAAWSRPAFLGPGFHEWTASLPDTVEHADVPAQEGADAWASARTHGLIDRFPVTVDDRTALVLASALAADVKWQQPFDDAPSETLSGRFSGAPVLRSADTHEAFVASTDDAGLVAVHTARSSDGLLVVSVLAEVGVPAGDVHRAAHAVAAAAASFAQAGRVSLFDLPLGDGHAWTVTEHDAPGDTPTESADALMAAWDASSTHTLGDLPGVAAVLNTLSGFVVPEMRPVTFEAKQAAVAEFGKEGFKAAAVTAMALRGAGLHVPAGRTVHRHATLRFDRAHAVVAVAVAASRRGSAPAWGPPGRHAGQDDGAGAAWAGVPVFSAWVERPSA